MKPYHKNPRQINEKQFTSLGKWLDELGDLSGIVHDLNSDEVIGGNQRGRVFDLFDGDCEIVIEHRLEQPDRQGTVALGYILWNGAKYQYRQVQWTPEQCEKANIVANKAGGGWDFDILANEFELPDLLEWGFEPFELGIDNGKHEPKDPKPQIDKAAELQEVWGTKLGQVWQLGEHRLVIGDCTDKVVVEAVMRGERAEMLFTDPPYGVDYIGGHFHSNDVNIKRERPRLANDGDTKIYSQFFPVILPFVDGPCYVWFADRGGKPVYDAIIENNCQIHAMIIWHKINATYAAVNAQYKQRHEPCMYFKPKGSTLRWVGPTDECTVWEEKRDSVNEHHPTQKPVILPYRAINNHDVSIILDCFLGAGSTLLACEQLGRIGRGIEISPAYAAVTIQRLADMGLEPVLLTP